MDLICFENFIRLILMKDTMLDYKEAKSQKAAVKLYVARVHQTDLLKKN